jgi:hypothetical protein
LFGREIGEGRKKIVACDLKTGEIKIQNPKLPEDPAKQFTFDQV